MANAPLVVPLRRSTQYLHEVYPQGFETSWVATLIPRLDYLHHGRGRQDGYHGRPPPGSPSRHKRIIGYCVKDSSGQIRAEGSIPPAWIWLLNETVYDSRYCRTEPEPVVQPVAPVR